MLSKSDKESLLQIARISIESAVRKKGEAITENQSSRLKEKCGAFVTLHKSGELRGCIGYIESDIPLTETVCDAAKKAALEDYRFTPVTPDELMDIEIEISILSPLKLIRNIDEIEVGKHGLIIDYQHNRGLLLPQVATEYGWDKETFLNQTARKAGLQSDQWKDSRSKIYIFTAEIFREEK